MAGVWAVLVLLGGVAVFEAWATITKHQTISMAIWDWEAGRLWARLLVVIALAVLTVHFVFHRW